MNSLNLLFCGLTEVRGKQLFITDKYMGLVQPQPCENGHTQHNCQKLMLNKEVKFCLKNISKKNYANRQAAICTYRQITTFFFLKIKSLLILKVSW